MTTDEYLKQATRFEYMIRNKSNEINRYRDLATSITVEPKADKIQTSSDKDRMGSMVAKIYDLENEVGNLLYFRNRIISQIESITDADLYQILYLKYIENMNFAEIRYEIHVSRTTLYRMYEKAIEIFEEKYGNDYLNSIKGA